MNATAQPLYLIFSIHQSEMQNLLLNQITPVRKRAVPQGQHPDNRNKHYVGSLHAGKGKTILAADKDQEYHILGHNAV
jgi:hypothetical protein